MMFHAEVEVKLAGSTSRQIPLGKVDPERLPPEVVELMDEAEEGIDLRRLSTARRECLAWLQQETLR